MTEINWKRVALNYGFVDEKTMWEELYVKGKSSIADLSNRLTIGTHTVKRRLAFYHIETRGRGGSNNSTPPRRNVLWHVDQRVVHNSTIKELVWLTGCSPAVISSYKNAAVRREDEVLCD